jgi:hypothetical protein
MNLLDFPLIAALRQNHAVEHGTIHMLSQRFPHITVVGHSTLDGFVLYGTVDTEAVAQAASEALARLQAGQRELAIHPRCGTNLAVTGVLTGLAALGVMALGSKGRFRLSRLPTLLLATTAAALISQPAGLVVQERLTTSSELAGVRLALVLRQQVGNLVIHRIKLTRG